MSGRFEAAMEQYTAAHGRIVHGGQTGPIWEEVLCGAVQGYRSTASDCIAGAEVNSTTADYAAEQLAGNERKTLEFLLPYIRQAGAQRLLDVGCGVGRMVGTLLDQGYDAYGVDIAALVPFWADQAQPRERFFIVDPHATRLPFADGSIDFAFSFGVIEHVGTRDGHADRRPNYHDIRRVWLREVCRVIRPGGHLLLGGPNRRFPIDVAHGLDARASALERGLSRWAGVSVHKTWGDNFLWSYGDVRRYLDGLDYELRPLSIARYLKLSRVPAPLRPAVKLYLQLLPPACLASGLNPWVMALIRIAGRQPPGGVGGPP